MNRSAELQLGAARRAPNAPTRRSALQARGSWSQCVRKGEWRLPMNRLVAQAFQPAGLPDFRVRWTRNGRLESRRTRRLESLRYEPASVHGPNARQNWRGGSP